MVCMHALLPRRQRLEAALRFTRRPSVSTPCSSAFASSAPKRPNVLDTEADRKPKRDATLIMGFESKAGLISRPRGGGGLWSASATEGRGDVTVEDDCMRRRLEGWEMRVDWT